MWAAAGEACSTCMLFIAHIIRQTEPLTLPTVSDATPGIELTAAEESRRGAHDGQWESGEVESTAGCSTSGPTRGPRHFSSSSIASAIVKIWVGGKYRGVTRKTPSLKFCSTIRSDQNTETEKGTAPPVTRTGTVLLYIVKGSP